MYLAGRVDDRVAHARAHACGPHRVEGLEAQGGRAEEALLDQALPPGGQRVDAADMRVRLVGPSREVDLRGPGDPEAKPGRVVPRE